MPLFHPNILLPECQIDCCIVICSKKALSRAFRLLCSVPLHNFRDGIQSHLKMKQGELCDHSWRPRRLVLANHLDTLSPLLCFHPGSASSGGLRFCYLF